MAAYISPKKSWIRLFLSLCAAGLTAPLLNILLSGPRPGPLYDLLLERRPPPAAAAELLLIETGDLPPAFEEGVIDPAALVPVILALTEMDAAALLVLPPVLGLSAPEAGGGETLVPRIEAEFSLLSRNIRNLFEAIRAGSVAPAESDRYVGELVDLAGQGKERLIAALAGRDGEGMLRFERAAAAFGQVRQGADLRLRNPAGEQDGPGGETLWYSRLPPDRDGRFRRAAPVIPAGEGQGTGHIVYGLFRDLYPGFGIEDGEAGPVLRNTAAGGGETLVALDKGGAVLLDPLRGGEDFRRIGMDIFSAYEEADRALGRLLGEAEGRGIYNSLEPEDYPPLRYSYARILQEDMLEEPDGERRLRWREARKAFFAGLEDFLYGPAEMALITGYEELAASGELDEAGAGRITALRDELIGTFALLREKYREARALREKLAGDLFSSLCILGSGAGKPSAVEASALFANTLLAGRPVIPETDRKTLLWSLGCALLSLLCLRRRGALLSLLGGIFFTLAAAAGFSLAFISGSPWLDPLIPAGTVAAAAGFSALWALGIRARFVRRFRNAYGPFAGEQRLRRLIRGGKPLPEKTISTRAAVLAVRNTALAKREDREDPGAVAAAEEEFRETAARFIREAGGVVLGYGGDTAMGAFGSPLEEEGNRRGPAVTAPAVRAAELVFRLRGAREIRDRDSWHFGLDTGDCAFHWSPLSGYCAFGRPALRARIFAGLAFRCHAGVLVSAAAAEELPGAELRKPDIPGVRNGTGGEAFFELVSVLKKGNGE